MFLLLALFSDKPEVFLPKYSQTAILHAAHFRRVVKQDHVGSKKKSDVFSHIIKGLFSGLSWAIHLNPGETKAAGTFTCLFTDP